MINYEYLGTQDKIQIKYVYKNNQLPNCNSFQNK